jgi:hypothetical protein
MGSAFDGFDTWRRRGSMASDAQQPERVGSEPPRLLFTLLNPIMRGLLRTPAHGLVSGRLMLLTVTGRATGKRYTIPVGYARVGDVLYTGTGGR